MGTHSSLPICLHLLLTTPFLGPYVLKTPQALRVKSDSPLHPLPIIPSPSLEGNPVKSLAFTLQILSVYLKNPHRYYLDLHV